MSDLTHDLVKFLHYAYETKLRDLKFYKSEVTVVQIHHKLEKINEIKRSLELLETISLQHYELETILNHGI